MEIGLEKEVQGRENRRCRGGRIEGKRTCHKLIRG